MTMEWQKITATKSFITLTPDFKSHQRFFEGVELLQCLVRRFPQDEGQQVVEDRLHPGQVPVKLGHRDAQGRV